MAVNGSAPQANRVIFIALAKMCLRSPSFGINDWQIIVLCYFIKKNCHETNDPRLSTEPSAANAHGRLSANDQNWLSAEQLFYHMVVQSICQSTTVVAGIPASGREVFVDAHNIDGRSLIDIITRSGAHCV
jgi:hypothetical protein